jgi:hypothetical protein
MATVPRRLLAPRACAVVVAASALLAVPVGPASAAPLVPGGRWTTGVDLPDAWAGQADRLGVAVAELRQRENGCTAPEVRAGDSTCGDDEGDLAGQVVATVAAGRWVDDDCAPTTQAAPLDLAGATTRLAVAGPECLLVALDFPDGDDDDLAQSDSLGFTLSLVAGGPGGDVAEGGTTGGTTTGGPTSGGTTTGGTGSGAAVAGASAVGGPGTGAGGAGGSTGGAGAVAGRGGAPAVGGTSGGSGTGSPSSVAGTAGGAAGGTVRGGVAEDPAPIGSTTADLEVGADPTEEAGAVRSLLGDPLALGALLLGTTALLWLLFLVLRRRRGERA